MTFHYDLFEIYFDYEVLFLTLIINDKWYFFYLKHRVKF